MRTTTLQSYTAQRRWMERTAKQARDLTTVKRYGDRVLLADGYMLTFIPYGALPETLLASETEARHWGTETPTRTTPESVLDALAESVPVYMTTTLHRLAGPKSLCHLLVNADGEPMASLDADKVALVVSDVEADDLHYRMQPTQHCVSIWQGDGDDALLLGAIMPLADTRRDHWYLTQRLIGLPTPATPAAPATPAKELTTEQP